MATAGTKRTQSGERPTVRLPHKKKPTVVPYNLRTSPGADLDGAGEIQAAKQAAFTMWTRDCVAPLMGEIAHRINHAPEGAQQTSAHT